jgi:hypothetical protein
VKPVDRLTYVRTFVGILANTCKGTDVSLPKYNAMKENAGPYAFLISALDG